MSQGEARRTNRMQCDMCNYAGRELGWVVKSRGAQPAQLGWVCEAPRRGDTYMGSWKMSTGPWRERVSWLRRPACAKDKKGDTVGNWWGLGVATSRLEERRGGQTLGALTITRRSLNQRENVSLSDGLRDLFLRMVQGARYPSVPDGFLRVGVG